MNNKIFKILTVVFMFIFLAVAKSGVNAVKVEEIVDGVLREGKCSFIYKRHKDEVSKTDWKKNLKFDGKILSEFIDKIKSSDEFKKLEARCGKERRDNIILVLMFKYIYENSHEIFKKKGEKLKEYLIFAILSMRNERERREDKVVAGKVGEYKKRLLMGFYKSLEKDCFFELIQ